MMSIRRGQAPSWLPWLIGSAALAAYTIHAVLSETHEPAVPLDDSYIHFQYARALARGMPFEYTPGATPTPGATSVLWPVVLAPLTWALGGTRLIWAAWVLGWVALAALAHETRRLAQGLVSSIGAWLTGLSVLCFGGFVWFATSGMEVVPFAWLLVRASRRAAERWEAAEGGPRPSELTLYAWLLPLMRPEGLLATVGLAMTLFATHRGRGAATGAAALAGLLGPSTLYLMLTGSVVSSTATAKWLPLNPYVDTRTLLSYVSYNTELFFGTLLDGRLWTSVFLPEGGRIVAWAALAALPIAGIVSGHRARAVIVALLALGALVPTSYETFLVNRVRYIWPFTSGWLIGLIAVCDLTGELIARWSRTGRAVSLVLSGLAVGLLVSRVPASVTDLQESASAVHAQQVSLGRWVREHLPEGARVGLNDTGAIAYFGERPTFDVVGLTTAREAHYWAAGPGSRFEHYEHLPTRERPTHFVVYPEWFGIDPLLGEQLTSRTVHATILGGPTMSVHRASYDVLGSGELPLEATGTIVDRLDVADLQSERVHDYRLFDATQRTNAVIAWRGLADGGRLSRSRDRFELALGPGSRLVLRVGASQPTTLAVRVGGSDAGRLQLSASPWQEHTITLGRHLAPGRHPVEVTASGGTFDSLHYWALD